MSYSDVSNINPKLKEVSFYDVKKGDSVVFEGNWYKALEDSVVNDGYVGFQAENEEFKTVVVQVRKNDMGYNSRLLMEKTPPTPSEEVDTE